MQGWSIPPPREPSKSRDDFVHERKEKVRWLEHQELLHSERIKKAVLKIPREDFIPFMYRDYAYREVPFPIPGTHSTISCPHSYPLFYEPLGLDEGHRFLEVGLGSGYGTALAQEIVGPKGLVVSVEIDPLTFEYGKNNLKKTGYEKAILVLGDGGLGYPQEAPYDRICITAACQQVPPPLIEQLAMNGRLIAPMIEREIQNLTLFEKRPGGIRSRMICEVLYLCLRGKYAEG